MGNVAYSIDRHPLCHRGSDPVRSAPDATYPASYASSGISARCCFSGSDPILTTSQLAALVKSGTVRYFLLNGSGGGSSQSALITWITQHSKVVVSSQWQSSSTSSTSSGFGGSEQLYEITSGS